MRDEGGTLETFLKVKLGRNRNEPAEHFNGFNAQTTKAEPELETVRNFCLLTLIMRRMIHCEHRLLAKQNINLVTGPGNQITIGTTIASSEQKVQFKS